MEETLVCDNGTGFIKIGRASLNTPEYTVPSVIGTPHPQYAEFLEKSLDMNAEFIAEQIEEHRAALKLVHPMEEGIVKDWDAMEKVWNHAFAKFPQDFSKTRLMLTEAPMNPLKNREKMAEVMFEKFGFAGINVQVQAVLSLYAMGRVTGLVVDSGDGVTHCIPVAEGVVNKPNISRLNLAGRHITEYMTKLMLVRGYNFSTTSDFETVREIKEKLCFVSSNLEEDRKLGNETTVFEEDYMLPDSSWVKIGKERFEASEALFKPYLFGSDMEGISEMIFKSIMSSDMNLRPLLFKSILLSGGTTMLPGFSTRVLNDIKKLHEEMRKGASTNIKFRVEDPPYRRYLVYIGATTLARMLNEQYEQWVYKFNWEEEGPRVVHKFR